MPPILINTLWVKSCNRSNDKKTACSPSQILFFLFSWEIHVKTSKNLSAFLLTPHVYNAYTVEVLRFANISKALILLAATLAFHRSRRTKAGRAPAQVRGHRVPHSVVTWDQACKIEAQIRGAPHAPQVGGELFPHSGGAPSQHTCTGYVNEWVPGVEIIMSSISN